jgi:DNA processing protein
MCGFGTGPAPALRLRLDPSHPCWPPRWREMPDPPRGITLSGRPEPLRRRALAIVGTRAATPRGLAVAEGLAGALARAGWVIVSGLARGVDGAAHRGALAAGGLTVAVMGTGCGQTYPRCHRGLRARLEVSGCALSELPDQAGPRRHHFPRRNRLIAGLAEGVLVVEAPARSGALLTAYLALDMGREVFAVPGPVDSRQNRGCHHLLKEGAALVEGIEDVHRVLAPPAVAAEGEACGNDQSAVGDPQLPAPGSSARWIWDRLDLDGVPLVELQRRWPGVAAAWAEGLLALELAGLSQRLPGGRLARRIWRPAWA